MPSSISIVLRSGMLLVLLVMPATAVVRRWAETTCLRIEQSAPTRLRTVPSCSERARIGDVTARVLFERIEEPLGEGFFMAQALTVASAKCRVLTRVRRGSGPVTWAGVEKQGRL